MLQYRVPMESFLCVNEIRDDSGKVVNEGYKYFDLNKFTYPPSIQNVPYDEEVMSLRNPPKDKTYKCAIFDGFDEVYYTKNHPLVDPKENQRLVILYPRGNSSEVFLVEDFNRFLDYLKLRDHWKQSYQLREVSLVT